MSVIKPDPVAHMSDLEKLEQKMELKLERLENKILRWMLVQTLTLAGAMAVLKLFGR